MFDHDEIELDLALEKGVTEQDGYSLTENLIARGWEVHGVARSSSVNQIETLAQAHNLRMRDLNRSGKQGLDSEPAMLLDSSALGMTGELLNSPTDAIEVSVGGIIHMLLSIPQFSPENIVRLRTKNDLKQETL